MKLHNKRKIKGLFSSDEINKAKLQREIKPSYLEFFEILPNHIPSTIILFFIGGLTFFFPGYWFVSLFLATVIFFLRWKKSKKELLPLRLPKTSGIKKDLGNPMPERKKYFPAKGTIFIGNEQDTGLELWLSFRDILTHMLNLGTTGSGKTEDFLGLAFNMLLSGSGFVYVDPKGQNKLPIQIYQMLRFLGREDDFNVLNYGTGGKDLRTTGNKVTNTTNPFALGSSDALIQLLVSLMPPSDGRNSIFANNAQTIITGLIYALTELRDKRIINLSIPQISHYMVIKNICELIEHKDLSQRSKDALLQSLTTVQYNQELPFDEQSGAFREQFGYAQAYFGLTLMNLKNTYGHIYEDINVDVHMWDIIMNRRVLVTVLPSMEKAPQETANLGKIILSAIKAACSTGLGVNIEGTVSQNIKNSPAKAKVPFLIITDEYAAIATPGYPEMLTQGRSLGIAAVIGSQDYGGLLESDKKGTKQIIGNTNIKKAMRLQDALDTWHLFEATAAKAKTMTTTGYEIDHDQAMLRYRDKLSTTAEERTRIEIQDLQNQIEGEYHLMFSGDITRGSAFYADIPLSGEQQARINKRIVIVPELTEEKLTGRTETVDGLSKALYDHVDEKNTDFSNITKSEDQDPETKTCEAKDAVNEFYKFD